MRILVGFFIAATLLLAAGSAPAETPSAVGYVTKSATNLGWMIINKGAEDAAREAGVKLIVGGPSVHGALEDQINAVRLVVAQGSKAVAIAPVDSRGVIPIVRRITAQGIPVVAIDTGIDDDSPKSFVGTDNLAAAAVQAEWAAGQMAADDVVVLVNGNLAQTTGRDRRRGFVERLKQLKPDAAVVEVNTAWEIEDARAGVEAALRANPGAKLVANAWDDGTLGTVAALKALGVEKGRIRVIGFDGAPNALALLRAGWVQADVAQMLYRQGYEGVKTAIAAAKGEAVPSRIDTGHLLVTAENVESFIAENKLAEFMK
jgi:ribose transport system substrate-binding protein